MPQMSVERYGPAFIFVSRLGTGRWIDGWQWQVFDALGTSTGLPVIGELRAHGHSVTRRAARITARNHVDRLR